VIWSTAVAKSDKRVKLLEACRELLNEIPARELTLDLVAERSGINRGLIFYYFVSREGLLLAATESFRDTFIASFDTDAHSNSRAWLTDEITRLIDLVDENTGLVQAVTFELGSIPGVTEALEDINHFNSMRVATALGLAHESDLFRAVIGSWGVYCARLALQGAHSSHVTRGHLIELMTVNLISSLDLIRRDEPELGIPEHPFE
jgi:AcrR family transcriptional regulator